MNHLVVREAVHQDQIVARPTTAHGEVGELAGRDQARQTVQSAQYIRAAACCRAQVLAVEVRRTDGTVRILSDCACNHNHFFDIPLGPAQDHFNRHDLVSNDADRRLYHLHIVRLRRRDAVEAGIKAPHDDVTIAARCCLAHIAVPRLDGDGGAGEGPAIFRKH